MELPDDVGADVRRRRCGERDHRRTAEPLPHLRDAEVAWPEIVAPLADTVRFVDSEEGHAGVLEPFRGGADVEALGRDVEQLELSALRARKAIRDLAARQ